MNAHELHEKGKIAENYIAKLCSNAFQQDYTFMNPMVEDKELCDVLIILQNKAIIWQIKSLKEKEGQIKSKEVQKAIRQCTGAKRKMHSLQKILFNNVAGETKIIDCTKIDEYYLIVAIEDGIPDFHEIIAEDREEVISIFFSSFTRFALKYLNTVPDLVDYLNKKTRLVQGKNIILSGGEENLLAHFLGNARTFGELDDPKLSSVYFTDNELANRFENRSEVKLRLSEEQKYCGITDYLIAKRRESISSNPSVIISQEMRDLILSLLLNMNSLEKRMFGKIYQEAAFKAYEISKIKNEPNSIATYRSYYLSRNVLFIFGFLGYDAFKDKEFRRTDLQITAYGAIKKLNASFDYIMCIGTEIDHIIRKSVSFEWVFMDCRNKKACNDFIDKQFPDLDEFLKQGGILQDSSSKHIFNQNEYEESKLDTDITNDVLKYMRKYKK